MIDIRSAKAYCCEDISKIENYDKAESDKTQTWIVHHRDEIQNGKLANTTKDLISQGKYYKVLASKLIFMTKSDHMKLHNKLYYENSYGCFSKQSIGKISEAIKALPPEKRSMYGKRHTKKTKKKMSISRSKVNSGRCWWTNGNINKFCYECPEGFYSGMTHHTKG